MSKIRHRNNCVSLSVGTVCALLTGGADTHPTLCVVPLVRPRLQQNVNFQFVWCITGKKEEPSCSCLPSVLVDKWRNSGLGSALTLKILASCLFELERFLAQIPASFSSFTAKCRVWAWHREAAGFVGFVLALGPTGELALCRAIKGIAKSLQQTPISQAFWAFLPRRKQASKDRGSSAWLAVIWVTVMQRGGWEGSTSEQLANTWTIRPEWDLILVYHVGPDAPHDDLPRKCSFHLETSAEWFI